MVLFPSKILDSFLIKKFRRQAKNLKNQIATIITADGNQFNLNGEQTPYANLDSKASFVGTR